MYALSTPTQQPTRELGRTRRAAAANDDDGNDRRRHGLAQRLDDLRDEMDALKQQGLYLEGA
jgi:hypothetical protein